MEKRRWLSFVLAVFILSVGVVPLAFSQQTAGMKFSSVEVSPGEKGFIVNCIITDHPGEISAVGFDIRYPDVLEYVEYKAANLGWAMPAGVDNNAETRTLSFLGLGPNITAAEETVLVSLTFNISSPLTEDAYGLTVVGEDEAIAAADGYVDVTVDTTKTIVIKKVPTVTATASPDGCGTITPAGVETYVSGQSPTYEVTPADGYRVATFTVSSDAAAALSGGKYTFVPPLKEGDNITINVVFELIPTYKITASAGDNGKISPEGEKTYNEDLMPTYVVTPDKHYEVYTFQVLGDDDAKLTDKGDGSFSYTYAALKANSTIAVTFKLKQYTVTATAGANGTISNAGEKLYGALSIPEYTITPDAANNYVIDKVTVGGADVTGTEGYKLNEDGSATYTFPALEANATIDVTFKLGVFTVTTTWEGGVTIEPVVTEYTKFVEGNVVTVVAGMPQQFKIKFDEGYELFKLVIEDEEGNKEKVYELEDGKFYTLTVDKNYELTAKSQLMHLVTLQAMPASGGAVDPAGEVWVKDGDALDITVTVNDGWDATLYVYVAGEMPAEVAKYTDTGAYPYALADVTADYFVDVMFEKDGTFHSADCNMDGDISLLELMDFIELFKDSAIGGYYYDGMTMSSYTDGCIVGYAAGDDGGECLMPHSADCDGDCFISLSEFLRTVELWKEGYKKDAASTDCNGFVPAE